MPPDLPIFQPATSPSHDPGPPRTLNFRGRDETSVRALGHVLAFGTSQRDEHSHPVPVDLPETDPYRYARKNERCSACRWFEVSIATVDADLPAEPSADEEPEPATGRYLVVTAGRTIVPGEQNFRRAEFTDSPYEVVELLVQRRDDDHMFIPQTSLRALAQAAGRDAGLREAYLARVT